MPLNNPSKWSSKLDIYINRKYLSATPAHVCDCPVRNSNLQSRMHIQTCSNPDTVYVEYKIVSTPNQYLQVSRDQAIWKSYSYHALHYIPATLNHVAHVNWMSNEVEQNSLKSLNLMIQFTRYIKTDNTNRKNCSVSWLSNENFDNPIHLQTYS